MESQKGATTPTATPSHDRPAKQQGHADNIVETENEPVVTPETDLATAPNSAAPPPPTKTTPDQKDTALWADMADEQGPMEIAQQDDNQQTDNGDHPTTIDISPSDVDVTRRTREHGRKSDVEEEDTLDTDDISQIRDRETAQNGPRRSPNRSKKMKLDKSSVTQHDRSRSVSRRATGKGPKK
jgi:hypothetical protein